ncbi:hypothetical protein BG006_001428 [Podila minutissima]|uniref:Uncharacterized protein n=1 Tax=Podila minutissima TaxID=64525 RepID=A0A9P5SCT4_9FUNG|nr:hypothetical protein BG006_001428 [Podila minutissima]
MSNDHSFQTMLPRSIAECVPLVLATVMYIFNVTRYLIFDHPVRPSSPHIRKRCTAVSSSGRTNSPYQQDPAAMVVITFIFPWIVPQEPQSLLGRLLGWYCRILWIFTEVVLDIGSILLMILTDSKEATTTETMTAEGSQVVGQEEEGEEQEDVVMESLFDLDEDQTEVESLCGESKVGEAIPLDDEDRAITPCREEEEEEDVEQAHDLCDLVATHVMNENVEVDGAVLPSETIGCEPEDNAQKEDSDCQIEHFASEGLTLAQIQQLHSQVIDELVYIHETCQKEEEEDKISLSLSTWANSIGRDVNNKRPETPLSGISDSELEDTTITAPESEDDDDVQIEDTMIYIGDCIEVVTESTAAEKKKKKKKKSKKKKSGSLVDNTITTNILDTTATPTKTTATKSAPRIIPTLTTTSISTATKVLASSPTTDNAFCWLQNGPQPQHRRRRVPEPFEPMTVNIAAGIGSMDEEWMHGFSKH